MEKTDICSLSLFVALDTAWILITNLRQREKKIQIYGNNNTDAQKWKLHPNADGSFQITSKATKDKKALTNGPKSTTSGQPVQSYTRKEENEHQDWYFEPADEGLSQQLQDQEGFIISGYVIRDSILM